MAESERGQTTLLLAGVVAVALLLGVGVALVGDAVVHRMRARAAADAVAVAASIDSAVGTDMAKWYADNNIEVAVTRGPDDAVAAHAHSGPSQARSWAAPIEAAPASPPSPALVAILARAAQLLGIEELHGATVQGLELVVTVEAIDEVRMVGPDLGLCEAGTPSSAPSTVNFVVCSPEGS